MTQALNAEPRDPNSRIIRIQHDSLKDHRHATTKWQAVLENFTPMWFAICISSGGLGLVLNSPFPYPARWLSICGDILYVLELILFIMFIGITIARWIVYPRPTLRRFLTIPEELAAHAIMPITLLTIAGLTASQVSTSPWGGHAFTLVAYVLWWVGMASILLFCVITIIILAHTGMQVDRIMTPALFMPIVGVATASSEAGFIANRTEDMSSRLAVPMLITAYLLLGIATFLSLMLYTLFLHRLMSAGWPKPEKIAGLAILVGPAGQVASAFESLGKAAGQEMRFAEYARGTFFTQQTALIIEGASIFMALLFIGLSIFWLMIAIYGIVHLGLIKRQAGYNLSWWATVFPIVTLVTALAQLGTSMDSPAFRVLATALFVFLLICYLSNWVFTICLISKGKLLFGPTQVEVERKGQELYEEANSTRL